uniref:Uncharacterized protein n=1 Tax=Panagrolaimus sp. JU765 TaxID=591449 RepID=A0AC34QPZ2_9BILA
MTEVLTVPKKRFSIRIDSTDVSFENLDFTAANHETSNAIYERDLPEDDLEEEHEEAGEEQEDRNEEEEEAEAEQEDRDEEEEKAEAEQEDRDEEEEKAEAEQEDRNEEAEGEERRQIHQKRTMSLNLYGKSHTTVLKVTNPQIRRK